MEKAVVPAQAWEMDWATSRLRAAAGAALLLASGLFFFHLGAYGLWEADEARYAEIAREMLALKDFVIPHLNYVPYIEKPPLLYWLTCASFGIFGLNEFAARLVSAISALAGVLATFLFARRTFGPRRAGLSAAILATAPLYAIMAQVLTTDMLFSTLVALAMFALFIHYCEGGRWCWLAYLAMSLAALTKGPAGIALPVLSIAVFLWWEGELAGSIRRFHAGLGLLLVLAIALPWFVATTLAEPGFVRFYVVGEHLRRIFQPSYSHGEAVYFYLPVLVGGLMPWSLVAPFLKWRAAEPNPARRFCAVASVVIVGAFSLASAKLIPYILPAFPPLAVLLGDGVAALGWRPSSGAHESQLAPPSVLTLFGPLLGVLGAAVMMVGLFAPQFRSPYPIAVRPSLYAIGAILLGGSVLVTATFLMRRMAAGLTLLVITLAATLIAGTWARLEAEPLRSYANLSRTVARLAPDATLICYRRYVQSLPFYAHRRVILIGPKTELRFGSEHSPDARDYFFLTDSDLFRLWSRPGPKVLVLDANDLARLGNRLGGLRLIASEHTKRAIVSDDERTSGN